MAGGVVSVAQGRAGSSGSGVTGWFSASEADKWYVRQRPVQTRSQRQSQQSSDRERGDPQAETPQATAKPAEPSARDLVDGFARQQRRIAESRLREEGDHAQGKAEQPQPRRASRLASARQKPQ